MTTLQLAKRDGSDFIREAVKTVGVLSLGSILAFNAADTSASADVFVPIDDSTTSLCEYPCWRYADTSTLPSYFHPYYLLHAAIFSSSTQLADEIKTMDMSLPSYSAISDAKNTQESLSTLVIEQPPAKNVKASTKAAPKKGEPMKGPSMSSFLPSLDKQGPKQKAEAAAKDAEKKAQKGTHS